MMRLRDLVSSTIGLCAAGSAFAQDTSVDLGTLILGARLFEEPAQNVPGSLTLRFPEDLAPREGTDLGDIAENTPNITFKKTNADERLIIRGISAYPNALADPVGVIVNGVALPLGTLQAPTPIALDQAAVLVGPQGAHYGRNSEAGFPLIDTPYRLPGSGQAEIHHLAVCINSAPQIPPFAAHSNMGLIHCSVGDLRGVGNLKSEALAKTGD